MFSLRHLKAMVLILGVLAVVLGLITTFQVDDADAQGRISQWTRTTYEYKQVGSLWWEDEEDLCWLCGNDATFQHLYGNFKKYKS